MAHRTYKSKTEKSAPRFKAVKDGVTVVFGAMEQ